jgi:hypothetical protein
MTEMPRVLNGTLVKPAGRPRCESCDDELRPGDRISHTLDMRRIWHAVCLEKEIIPFSEWPKAHMSGRSS